MLLRHCAHGAWHHVGFEVVAAAASRDYAFTNMPTADIERARNNMVFGPPRSVMGYIKRPITIDATFGLWRDKGEFSGAHSISPSNASSCGSSPSVSQSRAFKAASAS